MVFGFLSATSERGTPEVSTMNGDSHGSPDPGEVHLARDWVNRDGVKFDLQVCRSLIECGMGGRGNDPGGDMRQPSRAQSRIRTFLVR
jgi:hypothetical protein